MIELPSLERFEFLEGDCGPGEWGTGDFRKDYLELRKSGSLGVAAKGLLNFCIYSWLCIINECFYSVSTYI